MEINHIRTPQFLLIDTSKPATQFLHLTKNTSPEFPIYYIGPVKDTISIGRSYFLGQTPKPPFSYIMQVTRNYSDRNLSITVDTTLTVSRSIEYYSDTGDLIFDSTQSYHAYLMIIKNISDTTIWMGRTFSLFFMHMDLKDNDGHWIKIGHELCDAGLCLTIQPYICLKPGEILISKAPILDRTHNAESRLSFGSLTGHPVYSNTFRQPPD